MPNATIVSDDVRVVPASVAGERLLIDPSVLPQALDWELKPEGLCQDGTCVPVRDPSSLYVGPQLDVAAVARALGRLSVVAPDAAIAAVALPSEDRRRALTTGQAPPFTLPDLEGAPHRLAEWHGRKKLLFAFASW